jgi:hypothetical protein
LGHAMSKVAQYATNDNKVYGGLLRKLAWNWFNHSYKQQSHVQKIQAKVTKNGERLAGTFSSDPKN